MFHPLREEHNQESRRGNDEIREGSVSDASSSRGGKMRDHVTLISKILAMIDRHEPDKVKKTKFITEHLAKQRIMPSIEEICSSTWSGKRSES
jgi:hypothetical protein